MPLAFVYGVATRQSPRHQAEVRQRDALFRQLILRRSAAVFDPDWDGEAVKFDPTLPWMPEPGGARLCAAAQGGQVGTVQVGTGGLARRHPDRAVDLAFGAGLAARVESAAHRRDPAEALSAKELEAFWGTGPFSPGPQARVPAPPHRDIGRATLRGTTFVGANDAASPSLVEGH